MKMNEKEARQIIFTKKRMDSSACDIYTAYGYLEAIKKTRVLEDGINEVLYWLLDYSNGAIKDRLKKTLVQWEEEK